MGIISLYLFFCLCFSVVSVGLLGVFPAGCLFLTQILGHSGPQAETSPVVSLLASFQPVLPVLRLPNTRSDEVTEQLDSQKCHTDSGKDKVSVESGVALRQMYFQLLT